MHLKNLSISWNKYSIDVELLWFSLYPEKEEKATVFLKLPILLGQALFLFFNFSPLGLYLLHMEVPGLGVESELQLPVYTAATATPGPSSTGEDNVGSLTPCATMGTPTWASFRFSWPGAVLLPAPNPPLLPQGPDGHVVTLSGLIIASQCFSSNQTAAYPS